MSAVRAKKSMKRLVSRTIGVEDIPKSARPVMARADGMLPQLLRRIEALPKGRCEEAEFATERQARNVCNKVRQYAKKHYPGLRVLVHISVGGGRAICYFTKEAAKG